MATLPRATKSPSSSAFVDRPYSHFDAGINTSTAWTEHLESGLSDDDESLSENAKSARALYNFEGKAEFRELTVDAGEEIQVIKEDLADGWSLVKNADGEIGLLPRTYYIFTSDFTAAPDLSVPTASRFHSKKRESASDDLTPRASPRSSQAQPIIPQNTGEWFFPSFRQSLLGGKSLNRFSSFVTSGAEEWVLKGAAEDTVGTESAHSKESTIASIPEEDEEQSNRNSTIDGADTDKHFVDSTHTWKEKLPPFRVLVHSPSKRTSVLSGAYTIYSVTSLFPSSVPQENVGEEQEPITVTVLRRYSQFLLLHTALTRRLPGIALPPLPEKQYSGRFNDDFVEARRGDLERYISKVVRHPVARYGEIVTFFLSCESDAEWKKQISHHLSLPPAGPSFYAHVFHPAFNLDLEDASEAITRFSTHTKAVGKGVQGLRNIFSRVRQARVGMSEAERLLSYSLLSLITSKPLAQAPTTGVAQEDEEYSAKDKGILNGDGAWCWRENCPECLKLTKAIQKTSDSLQSIADLYDDHARRRQLVTHEALKGVAHPSSLYQGVISTHKSTLTRYRESTNGNPTPTSEAIASRCETVLNTTMAEMETYHSQKIEDFGGLVREHLDGEIEFYEQLLARLRTARSHFSNPLYEQLGSKPRQPSIYERELEAPRLVSKPLVEPCPHVFDSAPMRPVSVALQEGMGMLLGERGSVFGRFW